MASEKKDGSFEKDLEGLEEIVGALEEGGLSLDESLKRFEEGIKLSRKCEKALSEAEKKIEVLTKKADGSLEAAPFDDAGESDAPPKKDRPAKGAKKREIAEEDDNAPFDLPGEEPPEEGELLF